MATMGDPLKAATTKELLKLARRIERATARRRALVRKVTELEAELRRDKRLLKGLADSIGAPLDPPESIVRASLGGELAGAALDDFEQGVIDREKGPAS